VPATVVVINNFTSVDEVTQKISAALE
jgi:hypothetical protein